MSVWEGTKRKRARAREEESERGREGERGERGREGERERGREGESEKERVRESERDVERGNPSLVVCGRHDSEREPIVGLLWTPHERERIVVCGRKSERESQSERQIVRKSEGERTHRQSFVDTTPDFLSCNC